jgi:predicted phage terminase large subunit-like protein
LNASSESTNDEDSLLQVKAELADALHQKAVIEARDDFYVFVKLLAPLMLDGNDYRDGRHIQAIAASLADVHEGSIARLMMALPPGSMKSVLLMLFVAWSFGRKPTWRIMWISHTTDKAVECSGRIRDMLRSPEYLEVFPGTRLRDDMSGVTGWKLTTGASFLPAGAGKSIAGYRFNLGILDDPLSEQTAKSDTERERINNWYGPGFRSRKLPDSRIVLVNTRWHVRDLSGFLLDKAARNARVDQWELISIPALLDRQAADYLMLPESQSYWPEYMTMDDLTTTRESLSRADWGALYMQTPVGDEGNIFNKDDFQDWDEDDPPECDEIIQTLDTAFSTKATADFSVIQTWGIFHVKYTDDKGYEYEEPNAILLNQVKGRWSFPELRTEAKEQYNLFKPDRIVIENKASGQSLIQDLKLNKLPIMPFQPDRDKVARAHAVTGIIERQRVWIPLKRKYGAELLQEALEFPKGAHDDAVDAMVMALLYLRKRYQLTQETVSREDPVARRRPFRSYWSQVTHVR